MKVKHFGKFPALKSIHDYAEMLEEAVQKFRVNENGLYRCEFHMIRKKLVKVMGNEWEDYSDSDWVEQGIFFLPIHPVWSIGRKKRALNCVIR